MYLEAFVDLLKLLTTENHNTAQFTTVSERIIPKSSVSCIQYGAVMMEDLVAGRIINRATVHPRQPRKHLNVYVNFVQDVLETTNDSPQGSLLQII